MIRVLIADDHWLVRAGLKALLALEKDIFVAGEASNGQEVLDALQDGEFDLILQDYAMPDISGAALISCIRAEHPLLPILMLSVYCDSQIVERVLKAGANGYLTKSSALGMIVEAIRDVAEGVRFVAPELAGYELLNEA
jgi:DNA-binding NarL/FixJ family response regulator